MDGPLEEGEDEGMMEIAGGEMDDDFL